MASGTLEMYGYINTYLLFLSVPELKRDISGDKWRHYATQISELN